jgi:adenylate cyclase
VTKLEERQPRKLAVILHADVVGSTTLVQQDETLAHNRIQDVFHRFSATIKAYSGLTHELRGDALVAEFDRASDAISAALAFQAGNERFNSALEDDIRPQLRVGISLGEVVIADNTVTGEGVVLAQRLEQLADSGSVCIQGAVHEAAPGRLPYEYESLGEQELKGFTDPVRAFAVRVKPGEAIPAPELHEQSKRLTTTTSAIALVIIVGVALAWWQPWKPGFEPASLDRMAFALPDKPSIAVLPFDNLSGDPEQEYFADGLTENVISTLSQLPSMFVIARNSTFVYKGQPVKVQQVAEDLGVRYVLEGSFQRSDKRIRVHAQLIDALTGHHLWAERFDRMWTDIFSLQDDITQSIVSALALKLTEEEKAKLARRYTDSVEAYDYFLRGQSSTFRFTDEDNRHARDLFTQAIALDPNFGRAYGGLAMTHAHDYRFGWTNEAVTSLDRALEYAQEGARVNPDLPQTQFVLGQIHAFRREHESALESARKTIALDRNFADGYALLGVSHTHMGRAQEAVAEIEKAMRLNPHPPAIYHLTLGRALYFLGRYDEAAPILERAVELNQSYLLSHLLLAAAYGQVGNEEGADWQQVEILGLDPDFTIGDWLSREIIVDQSYLERLTSGLRKAGLPE